MIFGNSDLFGICVEPVEAWSTKKIKNGLICFIVKDRVIGGRFFRSTLGPELIKMRATLSLLNQSGIEISSELNSSDAYSYLKTLNFPENLEDECRPHLISTWSLSDAGVYVFHEKLSNKTERILFSEDGESVEEALFPANTVMNSFQLAIAGMENI